MTRNAVEEETAQKRRNCCADKRACEGDTAANTVQSGAVLGGLQDHEGERQGQKPELRKSGLCRGQDTGLCDQEFPGELKRSGARTRRS